MTKFTIMKRFFFYFLINYNKIIFNIIMFDIEGVFVCFSHRCSCKKKKTQSVSILERLC